MVQVRKFLAANHFLELSSHAHHAYNWKAVEKLVKVQKYKKSKPTDRNKVTSCQQILQRSHESDTLKGWYTEYANLTGGQCGKELMKQGAW